MGKFVKRLFEGMGQALVLDPGRNYARPEHGFAHDAQQLKGDSRKVSKGLSKALKAHGKSSNDRETVG